MHGQANRLLQGVESIHITNCLRQARLDITLLKTFESCFSTYIPYDPKKTKLQYVTAWLQKTEKKY